MDCCMGENPPVTKPDTDTQNACNTARTGSMPEVAIRIATITVAMATTIAVTFAMNRVVWITLGTTCSLLPSERNSEEPARFPKMPNESATTINPKPPSRCIMKRNILSAYDR